MIQIKGLRKKSQLSQPFLLQEIFLGVPKSWDEVLGLVEMHKAHARVSGGRFKGGRLGWVPPSAEEAPCFSPWHKCTLLKWQSASGLLPKSWGAQGLQLCFPDQDHAKACRSTDEPHFPAMPFGKQAACPQKSNPLLLPSHSQCLGLEELGCC